MNIEEYIRNLQNLSTDAVNSSREEIYVRSGNELLANIKNRIQREGKDSNDTAMPAYSSKAAYFGRDQFVRKSSFKAKGKSGAKNFKSGSPHKSMYLEHGYKELRDIQGRQTAKRDLTYSGDLMLSYVLGTIENGILLGFNQDKQSKKRKGLEDRNNGPIFYATQSELDDFNKSIIRNEGEIINRAFGINNSQ